MIPSLIKRLLISILIRNQSNKIIPSKESIHLLQTDKEEKRDEQTRNPLCIACNENHIFDSCKIFVEKSLKERTKPLAKKIML